MEDELVNADNYIISCRSQQLDCRPRGASGAVVMGILNVTPDSFSDGGRFLEADRALAHAEQMLLEGAKIIDVGGESSRPRGAVYGEGARPITAEEEIRRVVPVIKGILGRFPKTLVSIDSYKPDVVAAALDAGAHIVNDITGLRFNRRTATIAAEAGAPIVVMHSVGTPGALPQEVEHDDIIETVSHSLRRSVSIAEEEGVKDIIIDPGFGFGKSVADNLRLLKSLDRFSRFDRPILIGISRKSTIGTVLGSKEDPAPPDKRMFGTLGATAVAVQNGASIVRTHDVRATVETIKLVGAIQAT